MTEVSRANLAEDVIAVTGVLRRRLGRRAGVPLPDKRLTGAHAELLRHVRRSPGCTVSDAAAALGLASNTVSTLVKTLVSAGHMVRTADAADGRVVRLELTAGTRQDIERWRDRRAALVADALGDLSDEGREALARSLDALTDLTHALDKRREALDD